MIPYGRQFIDDEDIKAVIEVLRSDWITTGPKVEEFEQAVADYVRAKYAVAVSSGTAALHCSMYALGINPGDEVIVPPMTFAATANCVVFQGGTPVFADVDPDTLLLDPEKVKKKITERTKAIIAVDFAGQPCDYDRLRTKTKEYGLALVADGCHALGAEYKDKKVGSLADMTAFSFHPVKHITTGEGGIITTDDSELANRMRLFRNHGITRDPKCFSPQTSDLRPLTSDFSWFYEMQDLGYNYRITDFQCALGISQLKKLPAFLERRREIAAIYDEVFAQIPNIEPLGLRADVLPASTTLSTPCSMLHAPCSLHAYHLYVIRIRGADRAQIFGTLHKKGIGVNVHYIPVHLHPFYRKALDTGPGLCPVAEKAYTEIISLPMFPEMSDSDVKNVIDTLVEVVKRKVKS